MPLAALGLALTLAACGGQESADLPSAAPTSSSVASSAASSPVTSSAVNSSVAVVPPPYVASASWVSTEVGPSLQVVPTEAGRRVSGASAADLAWREVLALRPDADTPGMRAQFDCHWRFARLVEPNKPSWNLEPDRPVVSDEQMVATRCNPGFAEE